MDNLTGNSATANNLTTIASVSTLMAVSPVSGDTVYNFIGDCIARASSECETDCNTVLANQRLIGYYDVMGITEYNTPYYIYTYCNSKKYNELVLNNTPIISINSLKIRTTINESWTDITNDVDISTTGNNKIILKTKSFPVGQSTVQVDYNAGYATIPFDLEGVVKEKAVLKFRESNMAVGDNARLGVSNITNQGNASNKSVTYKDPADKWKKILDKYMYIRL